MAADRRGRAALARRSTLLPTQHGPIELEITGSGPDVLMLHGAAGGFDQGTWMSQALGLRGRRVIAVSRPGYLGTPDRGTLDEAVQLLVAVLDELGIQQATVIGASAGGMSAAALAMRHQRRVSRLVMLSAVSGPVIQGGQALLGSMVRSTLDTNRAVVAALRSPQRRRLVPELMWCLTALDRRVRGTMRDVALSRSLPAPQGIAVPTLVLHGTADRFVPFAHATRTLAGCLDGQLVEIEGGGHVCVLSHGEVGERVRTFLSPGLV